MLKIAVCEDEKAYLDHLCRMLAKISGANGPAIAIVSASSAKEELEQFLKTETADVYLLDINLKNDTAGYELALKIRESQPGSYIVFISETLGMVFQSFKARPFDFLPKPVAQNALANLLADIERHRAAANRESDGTGPEEYITVRSGSQNYRLKKDEIIMIEKLGDKAFVYTAGARISCHTTLDDFEKLLADVRTIVRCHKGFIVNKHYIRREDPALMTLTLEGGLTCYVSRNYRKLVFE